jgi:hypothetical protein
VKKKFRRIVIDGKIYLWRFSPGYEATQDPANPWKCHDLFTAYLTDAKASPLQAHFITWEDPVIGGPLHTGIPLDAKDSKSSGMNLHTPQWAARIIRRSLKLGWQPEQSKHPFVIEHGVEQLLQDRDGTGGVHP